MVYISNPEESYIINRVEEIKKLEECSNDIEGLLEGDIIMRKWEQRNRRKKSQN